MKPSQEERDLDRFANAGKPFRITNDNDHLYTDKDIRVFKVGDIIPKSYSSEGRGGKISRVDFNKNDDRFIYVIYLINGCVVDTTIMGKMEDIVHPDYWEIAAKRWRVLINGLDIRGSGVHCKPRWLPISLN